jgi:hypothetical protein
MSPRGAVIRKALAVAAVLVDPGHAMTGWGRLSIRCAMRRGLVTAFGGDVGPPEAPSPTHESRDRCDQFGAGAVAQTPGRSAPRTD